MLLYMTCTVEVGGDQNSAKRRERLTDTDQVTGDISPSECLYCSVSAGCVHRFKCKPMLVNLQYQPHMVNKLCYVLNLFQEARKRCLI